jgi:protein arginine kinase activator
LPDETQMKCQNCQENEATVRVIDLPKGAFDEAPPGEAPLSAERIFCDACAKVLKLPIQGGAGHKSMVNIVKLLKNSALKARQDSSVACPRCGMTLTEFRTAGRLGCPHDYEVFAPHLEGLLRRVHNSTRHVGRVPGIDEDALRRKTQLSDLQAKLEAAIREEQYESAAQLRDEIQSIETE